MTHRDDNSEHQYEIFLIMSLGFFLFSPVSRRAYINTTDFFPVVCWLLKKSLLFVNGILEILMAVLYRANVLSLKKRYWWHRLQHYQIYCEITNGTKSIMKMCNSVRNSPFQLRKRMSNILMRIEYNYWKNSSKIKRYFFTMTVGK